MKMEYDAPVSWC